MTHHCVETTPVLLTNSQNLAFNIQPAGLTSHYFTSLQVTAEGIFLDQLMNFSNIPFVLCLYPRTEEELKSILHCGHFENRDFSQPAAKTNRLLSQACEILLTHLSSPPSLTQLAKQVGTNRNKLAKKFRETFHTSVFGWLRIQRLQEAARLLHATDLPISQISEKVGYPCAHFSTSFKEHFGCSPKIYRQRIHHK